MERDGLGPDWMDFGGMRRLSLEARNRWHRKREQAAKKAAAKTESPTG
jgi:hypothetical protein